MTSSGMPLANRQTRRLERLTKEGLDRVAAGLGLILCSPLLLILSVGILVAMGRPILFRQQRPGLGARPFYLIKFRTMKDGTGPGRERLTRLGRFLRATSVDELPELWNVLKGEMSLVGPRPLMMRYVPRYTTEQMRRHEVKPGITGWAQVNGRNALVWEDRFAHDVWYVDHWSLALDARILARTVWVVLTRRGINEDGSTTMSEFLGSAGNGATTPRKTA